MEGKERYITLSDRQIKDTYNNSQYFMSIKNVCKILNQQDKENQQLKQQLEEMQCRKNELISIYRYWRGECYELKQQLAEKDKAIENWQTMYQSVMQSSHNGIEEDKRLREQLAEKEELKLRIKKLEKLYSEALETVDSLFTNQDKISFCIEQLDKVKAELVNKVSPVKLSYTDYVQKIFETIDNQIKQLKEMK